ncbi:4-hydroxybenzoate 3-monooxygenase [Streptomyces abyssalis]|uniref:4-hydroxybenzoate 3-monooxygenase n=1 Tax=Streptomyces abyssalis TaxID=933944 RepID=A0A1E7JT06_9ACTN|nr:4-hydroxybenzoate 3-monooxygenase [Streptomyces abyssalis]OEU92034.1 4-hydroxybenzoate 3-monooxygenase [Streptomyces abyssalis]OEU94688.1 4-hydroxybenzoate 3-monooxygenase [Streptomyces abyssalis]OEV31534.1 4-hydroxybenzoate 3-monooxygenase [Streptomyces nanshensis]
MTDDSSGRPAVQVPEETTVGIIGGGPAGLLLSRLLHRSGIDNVVLESRDRSYVEQRQRAGMLEQTTVDVLRDCGAGARLASEGLVHDGIELRFGGRSRHIDFPTLADGRRVTIYAQTEIVKDLIALQLSGLSDGAPLLFGAEVRSVSGFAPGTEQDGTGAGSPGPQKPELQYTYEGRERVLRCAFVVGCDGFHGVSRNALPVSAAHTYERDYPYSWLGILADAPPACEELIYAHSPRGFALHSMRSPSVSRLYLQVPNGTDPGEWPEERIWDELDARFALGGDSDWRLNRGPVTAKAVLPMRSSVTEPMRHGRLFLAGDAAHIVPPTGAKGLNLAVADVAVLARAFARYHATGDTGALDSYSADRLRRVWRAEHFSYFMTTTLHISPDQSPFDTRLQLAQLERIASSRTAATELAENYAGLALVD